MKKLRKLILVTFGLPLLLSNSFGIGLNLTNLSSFGNSIRTEFSTPAGIISQSDSMSLTFPSELTVNYEVSSSKVSGKYKLDHHTEVVTFSGSTSTLLGAGDYTLLLWSFFTFEATEKLTYDFTGSVVGEIPVGEILSNSSEISPITVNPRGSSSHGGGFFIGGEPETGTINRTDTSSGVLEPGLYIFAHLPELQHNNNFDTTFQSTSEFLIEFRPYETKSNPVSDTGSTWVLLILAGSILLSAPAVKKVSKPLNRKLAKR